MAKTSAPVKARLQEAKFVADLTSSVKERNPSLAKEMTRRSKSDVPKIIESLVAAAGGAEAQVRSDAAWALGEAAECSRKHQGGQVDDDVGAAVPKLVELLRDQVAVVRGAAVVALRSFCPQAATAVVPALLERALKDPDRTVAIAAQETLRACGQGPASAALGCLIQVLQQGDTAIRQTTCETLGWLGVDALPAIKPLVEIVVGDAPESFRVGAARALAHIDPDGEYLDQIADDSWKLNRLIECLTCPGEKESSLRRALYRKTAKPQQSPSSAYAKAGDNIGGQTGEAATRSADAPRSPREARDRWLYEECLKETPYATIAIRLRKKPKRLKWPEIGSVNGIKQAAARYAKRHHLPELRSRQSGRRSG